MKYRIYIGFLLGTGFATLAFLILTALHANFLVAMVGTGLLMPGIGSLQATFQNCCESPLPMLAANGLIYSVGVFLCLVWPATASLPREGLQHLARLFTWAVPGTVAVGWVAALTLGWILSAPSDQTLTRQFNRHRDELETLASMAKEDSAMGRIAYDFIEPERGITEARWVQYRRLFSKVGATEGLNQDRQGDVYFLMHTEGSVVHGASKGFVYCRTMEPSPGLILPCSEQRDFGKHDDGNGNSEEYRRLSGRWFIYAEFD
jgi:hypothetical protein